MVRRALGAVVGGIAVAAMLSGCLLPIDSSGSYVVYANESSQNVVVTIEGENVKFPKEVAGKTSYPEVLDECQGTGIRVETKSGELIGRIDKQACPHWTLTINDDGSLAYVKDE